MTIVAVIEVWSQCSVNYDSVRSTATYVCKPETTVADPSIPKTEAEHWAQREISRLRKVEARYKAISEYFLAMDALRSATEEGK